VAPWLLSRDNRPAVDPCAPDAAFVIAVGPVTGTGVWSQSRFGVYAKSPATGGFGESYCGGSLAPKIKGCGVDALVLTVRSADPLWLAVDERGVSFRDASVLWGSETYTTEEEVLSESSAGAGAMVIGPAARTSFASPASRAIAGEAWVGEAWERSWAASGSKRSPSPAAAVRRWPTKPF
jgi:aldehyde:ferredoxin oxidoreductase